jgi:ubiquinone/menaquinone biosynthesis C-methylase UbiE
MSFFEIDVVSDTYRKGGDRFAVAKAKENLGESLKYFIDYASGVKIGSVLDVGCGAGEVTNAVRLAFARDDVFYVGVDAASKQIQNARKDFPTVTNMAFATARGDALPFADRAFDIVYENSALCWSLDPAGFIGEMMRTSKGIVSFRANVQPNGGQSYSCGLGLVKKVGSVVTLMFNPADYGITQFVPDFMRPTKTADTYQYPVWLQKVARISDDQLSHLIDRNDIEVLLDKTDHTLSLVATRKIDGDGPAIVGDNIFTEMVPSRRIVARTA